MLPTTKPFIFYLIISILYFDFVSCQPVISSNLHEKVDSIVNHAISQNAFPGAVLWVYSVDSVILHKSYGKVTYASQDSVMVDHIFDLASVTKVAASTLALMKMYELGLFKLDDPVGKYIKDLRWNKKGKSTFRELLSHQAGWKSWIAYYTYLKKPDGSFKSKYVSEVKSSKYPNQIGEKVFVGESAREFIFRKIKRSPLNPEQGYVYSDMFFYYVPKLTYQLTGLSFEAFLNVHFYGPLGLQSLTFNPSGRYELDRIIPTEIDTFFRQQLIHGYVHDEGAALMGGESGHAGLFGNARDLGILFLMLCNDGNYDGIQFFKPETVRLFTSTQFPAENNRRALGFDKPLLVFDVEKSSVSTYESKSSFGHTGFTGTMVWVDPEKKLVFVFLSNRVYPNRKQRNIYDLNVRPALLGAIGKSLESN